MRALAIDFETANESHSSPCAVGFAWINDGAISRREYRLIRPAEMRFNLGNIRVHGITPKDVEDALEFPDVMSQFLPDISGRLLLAHNASFDIRVLSQTCELYGRVIPEVSYLCTLAVARQTWPNLRSFSLRSVADQIGISFRHHHA